MKNNRGKIPREITDEIAEILIGYKYAKNIGNKRLMEKSVKELKNILQPYGISHRRFI